MDTSGIKYHLEQIVMQVGSCGHKVEIGSLTPTMLLGYVGELQWQIDALKELAENTLDNDVGECEE